MKIQSKKEPIVLLLGDIIAFFIALWVMLLIRYQTIPEQEFFLNHVIPFSVLFSVWVLSFFVAGLYEKHTLVVKQNLPQIILNVQTVNIIIAVLFFYFVPYFGITPKTNLFLYLIISWGLVFLWRVIIVPRIISKKKHNALLIATGQEMQELYEEINQNNRYPLSFVKVVDLSLVQNIDFEKDIESLIREHEIAVVVVDLNNPKITPVLQNLYSLIFLKVQCIDMYKIYEDIFDREPLSLLNYSWFIENISLARKTIYDGVKRIVDIVCATLFFIPSLALYPFVFLAIKLEDGGPLFIVQERVGERGKKIKLIKLRSMNTNDRGVWVKEKDDRITRVGKILRKTRIDETPQLLNVIKGDLSLVGPRPDIYDNAVFLEKEIPYYSIRTLVKPGLSGWAQIMQKLPPQSLEETKIRLVYDLYYVKNHSFMLDLKIMLRTAQVLLSRTGK